MIGVHFIIPKGATLTHAVLSPVDLSTPNTFCRFALYREKDEPVTQYQFQLIASGYAWATFQRVGLIWHGRMRVDDDYEHHLELTVYNLTGATVRWQGMCIIEVDDNE